MMRNIEGILEIELLNAEFPKKTNSFKVYAEFSLSSKGKKSEVASGKNPKWKEKLTLNYISEPTLHFKLCEKKTLRKDSVLSEEQFDLTQLKQKHKQDHFITVMPKGKIKGTLKLVLTLYPFVLTPNNICPNISTDSLIQLSQSGSEELYLGTRISDPQPIKILLISFSNPNTLQNYLRKFKSLLNIRVQGACQILEILEKATETAQYALVIYEHLGDKKLSEELLRRQRLQEFWTEDQLLLMLKMFAAVLSQYEKFEVYHGEINPLNVSVNPVCVLTPGIFYKTTENPIFSEVVANNQEWRFPYFSPLIMENYALMHKKLAIKPQNWNKSEVFSLGLVFLHMASLKSPLGLNDSEFRINERIAAEIDKLRYSGYFKGVLSSMLKSDEKERMSFSGLVENLTQFSSLI